MKNVKRGKKKNVLHWSDTCQIITFVKHKIKSSAI